MERPLSGWWCALGWALSTALFVGIIQLLGGPAPNDAAFSTNSTWAIAHGQLSCAYPRGPILISPLYPFIAAGVAAVAHIGSTVPFPAGTAHCTNTFSAIGRWSTRANALTDTLRIGYVGWLVLLAGIVSLLRATGRGLCAWEPATVVVVACLPPVWLCLEVYFHPQDLMAMGFALAAMACARRDSWIASGVLVTVAVLSQQFALLVAAPLLVLAPRQRRPAYVGAAIATAAIVYTALFVTTSSRAVRAAVVGTGDAGGAGTALSALRLHGAPLVVSSRVLPIALSLLFSWWVVRRLGSVAREPIVLVSVVALCLSSRLVFEQALFGYYFMALAVTLVLLDVVSGRLRGSLVAWLAMVSLVFVVSPTMSFGVLDRVSRTEQWQELLTVTVVLLAIVATALRILRRRPARDLIVWLGLIAGAILVWPSTTDPLSDRLPTEYWQIVLVVLGILLAGVPLHDRIRSETPPVDRRPRWPATAGDLRGRFRRGASMSGP